jgi:phosphopentomutase
MFTGVHPREFGMNEDDWRDGDKKVSVPTIFSSAKAAGYETAYYYSKPKLGCLLTSDVNTHKLAGLKTPESALEYYKKQERPAFVFLHVSGCEWIGTEKGWMSPEYLKTPSDIDERLKPVIELIEKKEKFIIITSDHGGHEKLHGTDHPDDFKLPFVFYSDMVKKPDVQNMEYTTTMLKGILDRLI